MIDTKIWLILFADEKGISFKRLFLYSRTKNVDDETALHIACKNGHLAVAKALINVEIKSNHDILNSKDRRGNTALHLCVLNGNYELAKLLVREGADLNSKNNAEKTPKEEAIEMNHLAVLALL